MTGTVYNRLCRLLDFAKRVQRRMSDKTLAQFLSDEDLQDSVMYALGQIGEIAGNIPDEVQEEYSHLFWTAMIGLRHRLFHEYESIDLNKIYEIAQMPINILVKELSIILRKS